jgi:MFS transporter, Spinster family, sphingosine-1-phosphate transporter
MVCICGLTCLYFIITNIQFWVTLYLINIIGATESMAQTAFAIICVTAPTSGAIASGPVTKRVGGYESDNALRLALFLGMICGLIALPIPLSNNFFFICTALWFYLFIGGMLVPLITGVYLANVEQEYRTTASSMANIFYEAFGYSPAPFAYGLV